MKHLQMVGLTLALYFTSLCQESIRIDYIGPIEKPFQTLIVSTKEVSDNQRFTLITSVVLDSILFGRFKKIILENLPADNQRVNADFGCFAIHIKKDGNIKAYYLTSKEISVQYFRQILAAMTEHFVNSKIQDTIETYLRRIGG
jgi:hypothetical protein